MSCSFLSLFRIFGNKISDIVLTSFIQKHGREFGGKLRLGRWWIVFLKHAVTCFQQSLKQESPILSYLRSILNGWILGLRLLCHSSKGTTQNQQTHDGKNGQSKDTNSKENTITLCCRKIRQTKSCQYVIDGRKLGRQGRQCFLELLCEE